MKLTQLPDQLALIRMHQNMSQRDLCAKVGVADTTISHWETGERAVTLEKTVKWAEALGYKVEVKLELVQE